MKKYVVSTLILALGLGAISVSAAPDQVACQTGKVRGFAAVRGDPRLGSIGAIDSHFGNDPRWFEIRFNCTGKSVYVRRIDVGVYDVQFPSNPAKVAIVSALNQQGASASVDHIDTDIFRVVIRGPLINNNVLLPRELPFYIAIF